MNEDKIYKLEPTKMVANQIVAYLATISTVGILLSSIIAVISLIHSNLSVLSIGVLGCSICLNLFFRFCFDWFREGKVTLTTYNEVQYAEIGVLSVLGNNTIHFSVDNITSIKTRGSKIFIYGDAVEVDELRKQHQRDKIVITCYDEDDRKNLIDDIRKLMA